MKYTCVLTGLACLILARSTTALAQITPMPTQAVGSDSISYDNETRTFTFWFNGGVLYTYYAPTGSTTYGGTFNGLSVYADEGTTFYPSLYGGVQATLNGATHYPGDPGVHYQRVLAKLSGDSVATVRWSMWYNSSDSYTYDMIFRLIGRTLAIQVSAVGGSTQGFGIDLDKASCDSSQTPLVVIPVPYLPLMNVLFSNGMFTSLFFDWEQTNASRILSSTAHDTVYHHIHNDPDSLYFAQLVNYFPLTNGQRNLLSETIYLTVSADLDEVLPNVVEPASNLKAQYKDEANSRTILAYGQPYPWILRPDYSPSYNYLDALSDSGVTDVALLIKNWNNGQFDHNYPCVLPPDTFSVVIQGGDICQGVQAEHRANNGALGGRDTLLKIMTQAESMGYSVGFHQNYVDYYYTTPQSPTGSCSASADRALSWVGDYVLAFENNDGDQSFLLNR